MFAAALILLAFGTGVDFGWQPMPDDAQRDEYVVQLEPEMLQALAAGGPVPIVSEVPDEAQPIGRIRIVVGRGELPRDGRETRLKPAETAGRDDAGIRLTQYTESTPSRYSAPPVAGFDPYTQVPPTAGAAAGTAEGAGWNGGAAAEVADARAATGPIERVGQGLQEMTEPVRKGVAQVDEHLRSAADSLGDSTQNLLDAIHPNRPGLFVSRADQEAQAAAASAPAAGWNGGATASEAPGWNGGQTAEAPAATPTGVTPVDAVPPATLCRRATNRGGVGIQTSRRNPPPPLRRDRACLRHKHRWGSPRRRRW